MMQMNVRNVALAASTFTCAMLLSFSWSEQGGASLSTDSAQARVGRPLTPVSVAGVARRQNRRAAYGYGAGVVGAGIGAAAVGTAAAVAATQPWNWGGTGYYGRPYVGGGALAANAYYGGPIETSPYYLQKAYPANGPWHGFSGWADYKARAGIVCDPGTMIKGPDGLMHVCQ
ncbi:hypothetical protein [Bradyrhizobium ottawaense]|nr:hypothetical protein [Bradyrhizobium ottawaense]